MPLTDLLDRSIQVTRFVAMGGLAANGHGLHHSRNPIRADFITILRSGLGAVMYIWRNALLIVRNLDTRISYRWPSKAFNYASESIAPMGPTCSRSQATFPESFQRIRFIARSRRPNAERDAIKLRSVIVSFVWIVKDSRLGQGGISLTSWLKRAASIGLTDPLYNLAIRISGRAWRNSRVTRP